MSWSLSHTGQPADIRQAVSDSFDGAAANYRGQLEELEVIACKERALAALDAVIAKGMRHLASHVGAPSGFDVKVYAYGSHANEEYGVGMSMHLTIEAVPKAPPKI